MDEGEGEGDMASEMVCGLIFRLLLPVCLAAGKILLTLHSVGFNIHNRAHLSLETDGYHLYKT